MPTAENPALRPADLDGGRVLTRRQLLRTAAVGMTALLGPSERAFAALGRVDRGAAHAKPRFRSRPDLNPPTVAIAAADADPAAGYLFIAPFYSANTVVVSQYGPLIVDPDGTMVWFQPLPSGTGATDFRMQQYRGKPVLTWWQGTVGPGYGQGEGVILDSSYRELKKVSAGNGYHADLHEFQLTPQNTALITVYDEVTADLSPLGGPSPGLLLDSIVQEIDVETGRVLFEWHSRDHVGLDESNAFLPTPDKPYDYFHVNSVDVDSDGNLLVSSRHTWTIYKIDRRTGEIIWRLGGKKSDFQLGDGAAFAWQHDARRRADGAITLFDNAANGVPKQQVATQSRGLVLDVDMNWMQASVAAEYVHPAGLLAMAMGNLQTLPGGDLFVGWGLKPNFSGFTPDVKLTLDADLPAGGQSYRAFRLPWVAHPDEAPALAIESNRNGTKTIYASWNGATQVARWQVLAGPYSTTLRPLHVAPARGFETAVTVPVRSGFVAVEALDHTGRVLGMSQPHLLA